MTDPSTHRFTMGSDGCSSLFNYVSVIKNILIQFGGVNELFWASWSSQHQPITQTFGPPSHHSRSLSEGGGVNVTEFGYFGGVKQKYNVLSMLEQTTGPWAGA